MAKFKVGDRVIRLDDFYDVFEADTVYTITKVDCNDLQVELNGVQMVSYGYTWHDKHFALAPEITKFEKGDIVRVKRTLTVVDLLSTRAWGWNKNTPKFLTEIMGRDTQKLTVENIRTDYTDTVEVSGYSLQLPMQLFELVSRPVKVKEVTMAEIEAKYGMKVKVVK